MNWNKKNRLQKDVTVDMFEIYKYFLATYVRILYIINIICSLKVLEVLGMIQFRIRIQL